MPDFVTKSKARIRQAIDFLVANRRPIAVKIEGEQTLFDSMIVKADHGHLASKAGTTGQVFIRWLSPPRGNNLIQSVSAVPVRFSFGKHKLAFTSYYITRSLESPFLGHIITYPEALAITDRRRSERNEVDSHAAPLFAEAKIRVRTGRSQEKTLNLRVFDVSEKGVGLLVDEEMSAWLERIGIGDRLSEVELYASWAIVKVHGTVRHKSRVGKDRYRGCHLLGIELDEELEHYG